MVKGFCDIFPSRWLTGPVTCFASDLPQPRGHLCDTTGIKNREVKQLVQALTAKKQRAGLWVMESDNPTAESTHVSPAFFPQCTSDMFAMEIPEGLK